MRRALVLLVLAAACREQPAPPPPPAVVLTEGATEVVARQLVATFERQEARKLTVRVVSPHEVVSGSSAAAVFREGDVTPVQPRLRSVFGYTDFYIVGPSRDPAGVSAAKTAEDALQRITARHRRFCSPVDLDPPVGGGIPCRGNAQEVLNLASRLGAYTMVQQDAKLPHGYKVLLKDVPPLHTTYVVALLAGPVNRDAEWFVEWLMSYRGREAVEALHLRTTH